MRPAITHNLTFRLFYAPIFIASSLVTAGGLLLADINTWGYKGRSSEITSRVIIFAVTLLSEAFITGLTFLSVERPEEFNKQQPFLSQGNKSRAKQQVLLFVAESIPFFVVRFVYTVFASLMHQPVAVYVVTAILIETIVIGLFLSMGFSCLP
jgi:hypothetical protein